MKDSAFLSGILSEDAVAALQAVAAAPMSTFSHLVTLSGVDPRNDLRYADLSGVNLTDSDLRGADLTGTDLRWAGGIRVKWDNTTILKNADLTGSIFAARARLDNFFEADKRARELLDVVARADWVGQAIWAATHLLPTGKHHDIAVPIVEELFLRAKDDFLRAELLRYLAPRMHSLVRFREMLLTAISNDPDRVALVETVFSLLRRYNMSGDYVLRQIAFDLMDSDTHGIRQQAIQFIMRTSPTEREVAAIRSKAESSDDYFSTLYVGEVARSLGDKYDLVTRDPDTNTHFRINERVTSKRRNLVAQRWLRVESITDIERLNRPIAQLRGGSRFFDRADIARRAAIVDTMWKNLERYGINIQRVHD